MIFRFHHQPSSVPCIIHVSAPISANCQHDRYENCCYGSNTVHGGEVGLQERSEMEAAVIIGQDTVREATIVMRVKLHDRAG